MGATDPVMRAFLAEQFAKPIVQGLEATAGAAAWLGMKSGAHFSERKNRERAGARVAVEHRLISNRLPVLSATSELWRTQQGTMPRIGNHAVNASRLRDAISGHERTLRPTTRALRLAVDHTQGEPQVCQRALSTEQFVQDRAGVSSVATALPPKQPRVRSRHGPDPFCHKGLQPTAQWSARPCAQRGKY